MLTTAGFPNTVIDYNSRQIDNMRAFGAQTYYGDATRPDLLHAAGIDEAKLLVVAIDEEEKITELVEYAVKNYPNLHVMARAINRHHVYELYAVGCRDIIRETYDSSIRMGRSAFEALGIPTDHAKAMADAYDKMDRRAMIEVADAYIPGVPAMENQEYIERVREVVGPWQDELGKEMTEIRATGEKTSPVAD